MLIIKRRERPPLVLRILAHRSQVQVRVRCVRVLLQKPVIPADQCLAPELREPQLGLRYSTHTARSSARPARVVGLFAWLRHTNSMVATAPLDPCAREMNAKRGNTRRVDGPKVEPSEALGPARPASKIGLGADFSTRILG